MQKISSSFFITRGGGKGARIFKRIRFMPLYSFPHHKDLNYKLETHSRRYFMHLDFDAFFAQVEQRDNPKLRGKPVSVGGNGGIKGIVMTCSYEARALGVRTGMSVFEARQICPELISLPCYGPKYEAILLNIMEAFRKLVPEDCIEQYSIDECFLELTPVVRDYFDATRFAWMIKKLVRRLENLTISIGLSFNKSYAKLATKLRKPDGLSVIREENRTDIYILPATKLWGVGSRIEKRLAMLGIFTIGDLANSNFHAVHKEFGINGVILRKIARGEDTSIIASGKQQRAEKSFNHHHTLTEPIYKIEDVTNEIRRIGEYMCRKMRFKNLTGKHLFLTLRFDDLGFVTEDIKLFNPTNDERDIFEAAMYLYKRFPEPGPFHKVRMFGMTVFDLHLVTGYNLDLFRKQPILPYKEIDYLKEKYGENIIRVGLNRL
jgi:DNA polymerase IV